MANSAKLNLRADKYNWVENWLPGFFDYGAIISVNNKEYSGRGIDKNEKIAFEKASAEALERAAVELSRLDMPWSTAAYPTLPGAKEKAYYELLGIDRVLCHHFCRKKMRRMSWEETGGFFPDRSLLQSIKSNEIGLELYELRPAKDARSVCAISYGGGKYKFKGFLAGFGTDKDVKSAAAHAVIECIRTAAACLFTDYKPKEDLEVMKRRGEPRWHFWMAQKPENLEHLQKNLLPSPGTNVALEPENISISDVSFSTITSLGGLFPGIPLEFAQARSGKLLTPQFGEFSGTAEVMSRLHAFNGGTVNVDAEMPHFYG